MLYALGTESPIFLHTEEEKTEVSKVADQHKWCVSPAFHVLGSVVGIANGYRMDGLGIESRWG